MAYGPIAIHVPSARATPYGDRSTGFNSSGLPLRPGAEKCAFFLKTGTCKFGAACWKDHPESVASSGGGICKFNSKGLPLRPGQEQCAFYMRTGTCRFGQTCKNDHPEDEVQLPQPRNTNLNEVGFPLNPGEPECSFYMKTGQCKFGVTCKFSHPNRSESSTVSDAELFAQLLEDTGGEQSDVAMELQSNAGGEADSMTGSGVTLNSFGYPVRPGEEICAYYLKTGTCQFGASCWKDHPEGAGSTGAVVCEFNSKGLPIRPGQEHCAFYMKTGTCKFGSTCKNDHPENVQELGTDAEVSTTADHGLNELGYPINQGEPECSYYMKTGQCKFGATCKFSHPNLDTSVQNRLNELGYPLNPGQPECSFYMKTGQCKFGATCKYSHPTLTSAGVTEDDMSTPCIESLAPTEEDNTMISADGLNELGYPLNHGEIECAFYMKTGHCKFGATCKFAHPSLTMSSSNEVEGASAASGEVVTHLLALGGADEHAASSPGRVLMNSAGYPLRPGAEQCTFYLKTGTCKFGAICRHDHPEGVASSGGLTYQLNSKGLPLRPGEEECAYYMRTGTCQFGRTCKNDHPEEVDGLSGDGEVSMTADDGLNELGYPLNPGQPECAYYMKTGQCKFGATCKFSHPTLVSASSMQSRPEVTSNGSLVTQLLRCATEEETQFESSAQECTIDDSEAGPTTAVDLNSLGYPVRPGVEQCAFYLKTGTCQFGTTCWKDHPEISAVGGGVKQELNSKGFPLRPGQEACAFYMRTGTCKFGWTCKNDHPEETSGDGEATVTEDLDLNELGYPLNPGEPECAYYMKTGQCKFGVTCKFSHPSLATSDDVLLAAQDDASLLDQMLTDADTGRAVEEEEVMHVDPNEFAQEEAEVGSSAEIILNSLGYPLRPGAEQCAFYLKTGTCKFGATCRNDHPEGVSSAGGVTCELNSRGLPLRPGQEQCAFYMKTGTCKFGPTCKNDHPEEVEASGEEGVSAPADQGLNDLGYPFNPGELECAFYMKTGQCKFGASCRFSHPTLGAYVIGSRATVDGLNELGYPWNHGEPECAFYMKTGQCKFGATCKFSHPTLSSQSARENESAAAISEKVIAQILAMNSQEDVASAASGVALNSLGYPIRRGAEKCSFFLKTGTCKFGATCKNDHPELAAVSTCEFNSVGLPLRPDAERCAFYMRTGTCKFGATCKHDHPEL